MNCIKIVIMMSNFYECGDRGYCTVYYLCFTVIILGYLFPVEVIVNAGIMFFIHRGSFTGQRERMKCICIYQISCGLWRGRLWWYIAHFLSASCTSLAFSPSVFPEAGVLSLDKLLKLAENVALKRSRFWIDEA